MESATDATQVVQLAEILDRVEGGWPPARARVRPSLAVPPPAADDPSRELGRTIILELD